MSFDISRLRRADWIVGGGAVALFIFMFFFKWYGGSSNLGTIAGVNVGGSVSTNGWDTFTNSRWIWLITVIVALGAVVLVAGKRKLDGPVQPSVVVTGLAALSTLLILYRIVHHPSASVTVGNLHASVGIKVGIWLGLIAAAVTTYGGYLRMQEEGTSLSDVRDQASGMFSGVTSPQGEPPPGTPPGSGGLPGSGAGSAPAVTQSPPPAPQPPPPSPGPPVPPPAPQPPVQPPAPEPTPPAQPPQPTSPGQPSPPPPPPAPPRGASPIPESPGESAPRLQ